MGKSRKFQTLRGMYDILPEDAYKWQYVQRVAREVTENYGFQEIRTPVLEATELFTRSVGDTTDIVQKEMFTFTLHDQSMTLRPEGTAGTVRALLQHGRLNDAFPIKFHYMASCFRYENPQAGRQRQFHQLGAECFGSEDALQDAEVIAMLREMLDRLGVTGVELYINSIGCPDCRPAYNQKLIAYYREHIDELCDDCKNRLERNPLRLLDCKEEQCQPAKANAPRIVDNLCQPCETHFTQLKEHLDGLELGYQINPDIVRGLDYYTRTVFEFVTTQIGAQGTVCGGGRYDGLVEELGGPATPGIGYGMGVERLILVMEACGAPFPAPETPTLYIGSIGDNAASKALQLAVKLREEGVFVLADTMKRSVRAQMRYADRKQAGYSCILGDNELRAGEVEVNNMKTGDKTTVTLTSQALTDFLWAQMESSLIGDHHELENMVSKLLSEQEEKE